MSSGIGAPCRRGIAAFAILCTLMACHSAPVVERTSHETEPAAEGPEAPPRAAVNQPVEHSVKVPIAAPIETPIIVPPCLPPEIAPQLKRLPKPKPPPAVQSSAAPVVPAPAAIDAEVRPLEGPVESVLGKKVQGAKGEDLGRVVDVLADADGRVRAAVIEFGGFLGVGNRRIAVDWSLLRFHPGDQDTALRLSVGVKTLQSVPEFKNSARPRALMAPQPPAAPQAPAAAPAPNAAEGKK